MKQRSPLYTLAFTLFVCIACSLAVSGTVVVLGEKARADAAVARKRQILTMVNLAEADEELARDEINARFATIRTVAVNLVDNTVDDEIDAERYDQEAATSDPTQSRDAPPNTAGIRRLPNVGVIYEVLDDAGSIEQVLVPISGQGYGGMMYGYLALNADFTTSRDILFVRHSETPGLGARVDRPNWRANWQGRRIFNDQGEVAIRLVRGAGSAAEDPFQVDSVSRATGTTNGVQNMINFWLGDDAFGPFLAARRSESGGRSSSP